MADAPSPIHIFDTLLHIFEYLEIWDVNRCKEVCSIWNSCIRTKAGDDRLYKKFYERMSYASNYSTSSLQFRVELIPILRIEEILRNAIVDFSKYSKSTIAAWLISRKGNELRVNESYLFEPRDKDSNVNDVNDASDNVLEGPRGSENLNLSIDRYLQRLFIAFLIFKSRSLPIQPEPSRLRFFPSTHLKRE
jgi:hypothetical protein